VVREAFTPPSVEIMAESNIEYLRIRRFIAHRTVANLSVAIRRMKKKAIRLILDLRDSTGGDLYEALDAVSLFLPGGRFIGKVVDGLGNERRFYSLPDQQIVFDRTLVLVGPHTASAAELFLAALKHYSRVVVAGQRTFGKCTSQKFVELSDGSALKLTNLKVFFPSGDFCNGVGLEPHIPVTDDELYQTPELVSKGIRGFHLNTSSVCASRMDSI
jgi:carboxyl-terminal processing protease